MSLIKYLITESITLDPHRYDGYLHHGTQIEYLEHIKEQGFWKGTHFGSYRVADYFANNPSDEIYGRGNQSEAPIIISIPIRIFQPQYFKIDYVMLEEPLAYTLETSEEEIWEAWEQSEQDVQASLDILESVIYERELPWNDNFKIEYL